MHIRKGLPHVDARPRFMGPIRWLVYTLGFTPRRRTILYSPSLEHIIAWRGAIEGFKRGLDSQKNLSP